MNKDSTPIDRRIFLGYGLRASAGAIGLRASASSVQANGPAGPLPTRKLGRTGFDITILGLEASRSASAINRLLRIAYAGGIRTFDTADCYAGSEPIIADWIRDVPGVREGIFLVTKDHPRAPSEMMRMLDNRLEVLMTDRIDLFLIHNLGGRQTIDQSIALVKGREFMSAVESIKKSGKARCVGFSTHHRERARLIQAAIEGGVIDAIMLDYPPRIDEDLPLNMTLDVAHGRGIGLIAMQPTSAIAPDRSLVKNAGHVPVPAERGPSPFRAMLRSILADERIAGCSLSMQNTAEIRECVDIVRGFRRSE